ncbi:serine hydrolase domain-containing protein [Fictibacillus phosphorivorans]|uniref:serine hydrolase domain-containing protein n=1 Tax=Fictibacillus phosphorivorans TaxID=1221500 RepID=UPI0012934579|nr:serine hydrolase [Fictibacillus phosphorivorans]MQR94431.1 class C beta-lactamase-related serine hydrolase [Fictibacillus phosphorivorans]
MNVILEEKIKDVINQIDFSGVVYVEENGKGIFESAWNFSNRSDQIENKIHTRFGIASGCKVFTAVAISQLVEKRMISFDTKLIDCLDIPFKHISSEVTVHHLLTHTSGIPDYFDEEFMDDFEELWVKNPMYHIRRLEDFLPLFQDQPMKNQVGASFSYNNAGFILLGLIVEKASGLVFSDYVQKNILDKADMTDSGYFSFDSLPANTATGYIENSDGTWKTNIYSLPVKGGADGGAFVTAYDMSKFWRALMGYQLLNERNTRQLLTPYTQVNDTGFYGYGIWIKKDIENNIFKYHVMGYDPGVSFHSAHYPDVSINVVICSNKSDGAFDIMKVIEEEVTNKIAVKK